jgi:hypothetical protein
VSVIVLVAVILTTWQIAEHVNSDKDRKPSPSPAPTASTDQNPTPAPQAPAADPKPVGIADAYEFDPHGGGQDVDGVPKTYDGDPATGWRTLSYRDARLQQLKPGLGIVYDLGEPVDLKAVDVDLKFGGEGTTFEVRAAPEGVTAPPPASANGEDAFTTVGTGVSGQGTHVPVVLEGPVKTRYVLIWFTELPSQPQDEFSQPGLKNGINEIRFTG